MLDLTNFKKSIKILDNLLIKLNDTNLIKELDKTLQEGLISGAIQNFEVTYELAWKFIKRWLEHNMGNSLVDGVSRRELFRLAHESALIDNVDQWMLYHRARNETSHTYDSITVEEVFMLTKQFINDVKNLFHALEIKND